MDFKKLILAGLLCFLSLACTASPAVGADHYAAPNGTPQGDGSLNNPWDLQTALNQPSSVGPGDTIWLRGGTYHSSNASGFSSMINGTAVSPIIVRNYTGAHVSIDGSGTSAVLTIYGSYVWFWGLEIVDFSAQPTAASPTLAMGVNVYGTGVKCINMVVHDTAQGFSAYDSSPNSEFYGNVVYYNGYVASTRNAGHGLYLQNISGSKVVSDNFVGDNADEGIQIYGSGTADVVGFDVEGNSLYNTSSWPTPNYQYNVIIAGGVDRKNITYNNNFSYFPLASPSGYVDFGQYTVGQDITIQNNIFAGGEQAVEVSDESGPVTFTGNTLVAGTGSLRLVLLDTFPSLSAYAWNNNTYYDQTSYHFYLNQSGSSGFYEPFSSWLTSTGFDANSTYQTSTPTGVWVYVRPNKYEVKRANVTIYNWDQKPSIAVDLSNVLSPGDQFAIQDAQNFYGPSVYQGTYQGGTVNFRMTSLPKATPIGFAAPAHTAPQFGTFVVVPLASLGVPSAATFVGLDAATQGSWQGKYGSDGYSIPNVGQSLPSYATFGAINAPAYTWAPSTSDVRALKLPGSSSRVASTWYNKPAFSFDINLVDSSSHQVAVYALDWDSYQGIRGETIQVVDANNPAHILDTETLSNFTMGTYLVWNITGHVTINVTWSAGVNAVVSGVFFGPTSQVVSVAPAIASASGATFTVGTSGTFTVMATGSPAATLSESGALPNGVAFNASTGVLSGTPASGANGSYPLTFTASNGVNPNATQNFTLTVNPITQAPAITSANSTTFTVGTSGMFTVTATGIPSPALSESGALPGGVTFNVSTGLLSGTPASGATGSYPITFTASNGVNPNAPQNFTLTVNAAAVSGSGVAFLGSDTTTQGNWLLKYGIDGYSIANSAQVLPSYVKFTPQNASVYTWVPTTNDVRALTVPGSSSRIASTWYNTPSFSYDVNITDGNVHQVALYALDWDSYQGVRGETITIVDANNPSNVLDSESLSNYQKGVYLVWSISKHVKINVMMTSGVNATISGVFFGAGATASFVKADTATQGNWLGKYGVDGYVMPNVGQSIPSYAVFAVQNQSNYTWAASTSDVRALLLPGGGGAIASTWYAKPTFNFDIKLTDGIAHQIALYALDWDSYQGVRAETIQIVDADSNAVLDTESLASFTTGTYVVWNITGHVRINVTLTNGVNAVISGVFFK